jgi:ureidoacrylate peracid hydrolase
MSEILMQADPEPININTLKTAVIVVDMQNAFVSNGGYFDLAGYDVLAAQRIIGPCKRIISVAREKGSKIVYLQMGYSPDLSDAGGPDSLAWFKSRGLRMIRQNPELKEKLLVYGTWGTNIVQDLEPRQGDLLVKKQKYDGFVGTNLDIILRTHQIQYLLFLGVATNICVESTLRHAFFLDYFPILVSDGASQAGASLLQDATIHNVRSTFGWVTTSKNLLSAFGKMPGDLTQSKT